MRYQTPTMTYDRWLELQSDPEVHLTEEEIEEGWHFCYAWDGLLIGPGMDEMNSCECQ